VFFVVRNKAVSGEETIVILTIASGKGGTGKTTLAVNLCEYLTDNLSIKENVRLLDCDVEAPNDNLFIKANFSVTKDIAEKKPVWNSDKCKGCGKCKEVCRYNSIAIVKGKVLIFNDLCHSCGACTFICPNGALPERDHPVGKVFTTSVNRNPFFAYGLLNVGETATPSMVKAVKSNITPSAFNIIDAPPGTGCSVVAALENSDVAVLVTEPTPFGLHDLKLAVELTNKMKIPTGVVINRSDGNDHIILDFLDKYNIPIIGRIPFDRKYAEAYSRGEILVHIFPKIKNQIIKIYTNILKLSKTPFTQYTIPVLEEVECSVSAKAVDETNSNESNTIPKEIMIISGKGGTGKTTISAALSVLARPKTENNKIFADCDVDAADLHLLLKPEVIEKNNFSGSNVATINFEDCTGCGRCAELCRFNAIKKFENKYKINELNCEGCGLCLLVCQDNAIKEKEKINGQWFISDTEHGQMIHARLGIAEENSGKLVSIVRTNAAKLAEKTGKGWILGDGPPGIGCPVIASVTGIDAALVVTEPTVSGIHDMTRILQLIKHFKINAMVVINKADLNLKMADKIKETAALFKVKVIAEIPFDRNINDALVAGKTIIEYGKGTAYKEIEKIMTVLLNNINE
jgi:MinD superfamily P-loop ATPase